MRGSRKSIISVVLAISVSLAAAPLAASAVTVPVIPNGTGVDVS